MKSRLNNQEGFTLIEIIAVLILLGILAAVAVPRYLDLTSNAELRAIEAGVAELNGRENMVWANVKLSSTGWVDDAGVLADTNYNTDLGTDYTWNAADPPDAGGGTLEFGNASSVLTRSASSNTSPGNWSAP